MNIEVLKNEIYKLKEEKNALIVAHNYQIDEVQEIADFVGDSFYLSKVCAERPEKVIVFCGVHFMAESAKILSPNKKVLLPEIDAGCPLADMVTAEDVENLKRNILIIQLCVILTLLLLSRQNQMLSVLHQML